MFIYGVADAVCQGTSAVYALGGMRIPPQHHAPILAPSVGAFWAKHYNRNVSDWLRRNVYTGLARRSPLAGLAAAFAVSALLHVWLAYVPLDVPMALSMGASSRRDGLVHLAIAAGAHHATHGVAAYGASFLHQSLSVRHAVDRSVPIALAPRTPVARSFAERA